MRPRAGTAGIQHRCNQTHPPKNASVLSRVYILVEINLIAGRRLPGIFFHSDAWMKSETGFMALLLPLSEKSCPKLFAFWPCCCLCPRNRVPFLRFVFSDCIGRSASSAEVSRDWVWRDFRALFEPGQASWRWEKLLAAEPFLQQSPFRKTKMTDECCIVSSILLIMKT